MRWRCVTRGAPPGLSRPAQSGLFRRPHSFVRPSQVSRRNVRASAAPARAHAAIARLGIALVLLGFLPAERKPAVAHLLVARLRRAPETGHSYRTNAVAECVVAGPAAAAVDSHLDGISRLLGRRIARAERLRQEGGQLQVQPSVDVAAQAPVHAAQAPMHAAQAPMHAAQAPMHAAQARVEGARRAPLPPSPPEASGGRDGQLLAQVPATARRGDCTADSGAAAARTEPSGGGRKEKDAAGTRVAMLPAELLRECCLYLDATSLCRAAQLGASWSEL